MLFWAPVAPLFSSKCPVWGKALLLCCTQYVPLYSSRRTESPSEVSCYPANQGHLATVGEMGLGFRTKP